MPDMSLLSLHCYLNAYLLSVAGNAIISSTILRHNADRLCEEAHLLSTLHRAKFAVCTSDVITFPTLLN